jgi:uncharacterized membrane protein YeaQ/YmgE (transglycosylase-associated protein family)
MTVEGIVLTLAVGFVAGLAARAVIPGRQDLGLIATVLLGLVGSLVGNLLAGLVLHGRPTVQVGGWWASLVGAIIVFGLVVAVAPRGRRRAR